MASEIRVNRLSNRSGLSTITFANGGVQFSGITTFANGDFRVGTGATILNPSTNEMQFHTGGSNRLTINNAGLNLGIGSITVGDATFTGSVSIGKTLTYEDVKNVDSIGIVTARTGVKITGGDFTVGTAITASSVTGNVTNDVGITTYSGSAVWFKGATANKDMYWSHSSGATVYKDNAQILMGDSSDLQIYHDGTNSIITNNTGDLNVITAANQRFNVTGDFVVNVKGGNEDGLKVKTDGACELYHDNSKKFETTSSGASISGLLAVSGSTSETSTFTGNGVQISHASGSTIFIGTQSGTDGKIAVTNNAALHFRTNNTERLRIDSSGNVLIGTTTANAELTVRGGGTVAAFEGTGGSGSIQIKDVDDGTLAFLQVDGGNFDIQTSGSSYSTKVRVTPAGKVGVGIADPYYKFEVNIDNANTALSGGSSGNWGGDGIRIENENTTAGSMSLIHFRTGNNADWHIGTKFVGTGDSDIVFLQEGPNEKLRIKNNGDIISTGNLKTNNITGKNLVINGSFQVDQRNDGAEVTASSNSIFCADRWTVNNDGHNYFKLQRKNDAPAQTIGTYYYMRATCIQNYGGFGGSSASQVVENNLEGYTVAHLNYGLSNAKQCTLSFWFRCSLTGSFGGSLVNSGYNKCHPFIFTYSSANTWQYVTYTFSTTGFTSGSFITNNGVGLRLVFSLGNGTGRQASAGQWHNSVYFGPSGETALVNTNGATMDWASVQLEEGTQATRFDHKSYGEELALCQRYYQQIVSTSDMVCVGPGRSNGTTNAPFSVPLSVPLCKSPTLNSCNWAVFTATNQSNVTATPSVTLWNAHNNILVCQLAGLSGMTNARALSVFLNSSHTFTMTAEL